MDLYAVLYWIVTGCYIYLLGVYTMFGLLLVVSAAENIRRARQDRNEDYETLAESRFTIPVSLIAPAFNEEVVIAAAVKSLLALDYPEYEVIVVNDGSRDGTLEELKRAFALQRRQMFYRRVFRTRTVRGVYQSAAFPRLLVIDKQNGGKADALNCGFNFARYRYVCTVDSDTVFFPNALLKGMRLALKDPARVLGVTSRVAISRRPEETDPARPTSQRIDDKALTNFQMLDYLRAFLNNRVGWSRLDFMLCSVGAFAIWRRDVVAELGGFSGDFSCEDIEFTFRAHEHFRRLKQPYQIVSMGDMVGRSEGPDTVGRLISQRARWQRVITETVWHYRRMLLNPRYGTVGLLGMPYYLLAEVVAPIVQVAAVLTVPLAWWLGMFSLPQFLLFLATVALANGVLTNVAILLHDSGSRIYPTGDLFRLMLLGPLDLFIYRPILFYAQAKGFVDFLRGDKSWHKFERNRRGALGAPA